MSSSHIGKPITQYILRGYKNIELIYPNDPNINKICDKLKAIMNYIEPYTKYDDIGGIMLYFAESNEICNCDDCLRIYHKIQQLTIISNKLYHYIAKVLGSYKQNYIYYKCLRILTKNKTYLIFDTEICKIFVRDFPDEYIAYMLKSKYNINITTNTTEPMELISVKTLD